MREATYIPTAYWTSSSFASFLFFSLFAAGGFSALPSFWNLEAAALFLSPNKPPLSALFSALGEFSEQADTCDSSPESRDE